MRASELKPGQFFEFTKDEHKRRCRRTADGYEWLAEDNLRGSEEVTPLAVTGWDDEPPVVKPEPKFAAFFADDTQGKSIPQLVYEAQNRPAIADAIESAAAAFHQKLKEPEQFVAGDWVVADSGASQSRYGTTPKQLVEASKWCLYVEEKFPYHPSHFRRATAAEVAEQQRKDYWQHPVIANKPDADGWIEWKGGKCPVADGTVVDLKFRKPDDFGDIAEREQCQDWDWSHAPLASDSDIIAYRLVNPPEPELQPILDWVEVVTR